MSEENTRPLTKPFRDTVYERACSERAFFDAIYEEWLEMRLANDREPAILACPRCEHMWVEK